MIAVAEIRRARQMSAVAFNVDMRRLTDAVGRGGHATNARRCVCWVLAGRGYTTTEIAVALRHTRRHVARAIAHTDRVLHARPDVAGALAA